MDIIYLQIADFNFQITLHNSEVPFYRKYWIQTIHKFYSKFIISITPKKIDFEIHFSDSTHYKIIRKIKEKENYIIYAINTKLNLTKTYYAIGMMQFDGIIVEALLNLLSKNNGFLLHASSAIKNERAILFCGDSGVGKSTAISYLDNTYDAFTDDTGVIRKRNGKFYIYQLPRHEKNEKIIKNPKGFLVKKVFFLRKLYKNKINIIKSDEMIYRKLLKQLITYGYFLNIFVMNLSEFIDNNILFYSLSFRKNKKDLDFVVKKGGD